MVVLDVDELGRELVGLDGEHPDLEDSDDYDDDAEDDKFHDDDEDFYDDEEKCC